MGDKKQCFFIFGSDTYQSARLLKAIETRFLAPSDSMSDLNKYDLEETSIETIKQTWYAIPFLVSYRLFILKNALAVGKPVQEALLPLLQSLPPSTICVVYESKTPDKRTALYKWLAANAKVEECAVPEKAAFNTWVRLRAKKEGIILEPAAERLLAEAFAGDTWAAAQSVAKLAAYAAARQKKTVSADDVNALCQLPNNDSAFKLTDALFDARPARLVATLKSLLKRDDPLQLGGLVASQMRTLALINLALRQGVPSSAIAGQFGIHPYAVSLALPKAKNLSLNKLRQIYAELVSFDVNAKNGNTPPDLGLLLLVLALRDTLVT